jgi:hypothetical protein
MQTMRFTEGSDVWSFGITMIEVYTNGDKPYSDMTNAAVISKCQAGYRAPQPKLCPDTMYALLLECWHVKAAARPTFAQLRAKIETMKATVGAATAPGGGAKIVSKARSAAVTNATYASSPEPKAVSKPQSATPQWTVDDIGARVTVAGYECEGTLQFVGPHHEKGTPRCGVQLDEPVGKSRGSFGGHQYFAAPKKTAVLVPVHTVVRSARISRGRATVVANATYATSDTVMSWGDDGKEGADDEYLTVASGLTAGSGAIGETLFAAFREDPLSDSGGSDIEL